MSEETEANQDEEPKSLPSTTGNPTFHVKVYSPFKVYYEGVAESVSAENNTGPFDVLPHHKNFITLLKPCEIIIRADGEERLTIAQGIMLVKSDDLTVFLDA